MLTTKKAPLKVIMDSNAFFVPLQFKIDICSELQRVLNRNFELVLLSPVKRELETLIQKNSPKTRKKALYALDLAQKCTYVKVPEKLDEPIDDAIVRIVKAWNVPVFTNDKLLRKRLKDIRTAVIYVREKSRLEIDGLIS